MKVINSHVRPAKLNHYGCARLPEAIAAVKKIARKRERARMRTWFNGYVAGELQESVVMPGPASASAYAAASLAAHKTRNLPFLELLRKYLNELDRQNIESHGSLHSNDLDAAPSDRVLFKVHRSGNFGYSEVQVVASCG